MVILSLQTVHCTVFVIIDKCSCSKTCEDESEDQIYASYINTMFMKEGLFNMFPKFIPPSPGIPEESNNRRVS